jgi:catechol 2,3-dioxygenase-like lactoylglutathione lyase family enzyme
MRVVPIRYCADVDASVRFYRALGLDLGSRSRPGVWVELPAASGMLALHRVSGDEAGECELAFEADEPLEAVVSRLAAAEFTAEPILDESFGRSVRVRDPDGVFVQVNEHDRTLYT